MVSHCHFSNCKNFKPTKTFQDPLQHYLGLSKARQDSSLSGLTCNTDCTLLICKPVNQFFSLSLSECYMTRIHLCNQRQNLWWREAEERKIRAITFWAEVKWLEEIKSDNTLVAKKEGECLRSNLTWLGWGFGCFKFWTSILRVANEEAYGFKRIRATLEHIKRDHIDTRSLTSNCKRLWLSKRL